MAKTPGRLSDELVHQRLGQLDDALGSLEHVPGALAGRALEAVQMLAELYGEALSRMASYAARAPDVLDACVRDELVGHLFVLHEIRPDDLAGRIDALEAALATPVQQQGCGSCGSPSQEPLITADSLFGRVATT